MNPLHVPSGVALLPVRTLITTLVPVGVSLVQVALSHVTGLPASNTLESKLHEAEYGLISIQSSSNAGADVSKSLANGRRDPTKETAVRGT